MVEAPHSTTAGSFEEVLRAARPALMRGLARFRIPPEDGEDLLQEVMVQFVRKRKEILNPIPWMAGAMRNECLLYWRRRRRQLYVAVDEAVLDAVADEAASQEHEAMLSRLEEVIATLNERCQTVLRLRYLLGCKPAEVAERTGYKLGSVDKILRRCVAALSQRLLAIGVGRS